MTLCTFLARAPLAALALTVSPAAPAQSAGALAAPSPSPAPAPDDPAAAAAQGRGERSTIVVIGRRLAQDAAARVAATPGGADLVDAAAFQDRLAVSLRDTLAFTPGVYTQPRFGQEVRISIRGSGISRGYHMRGLMLFQDGIPINLADNNGDFQELDPAVFGQIEVYRGANALRLGGSTLGGAINAITPTGHSAPGLALRLDGGSFDTLRGQLAAGFVRGRGDGWVSLAGDRSDGDRAHAARRALRFNGNAGFDLGDGLATRFYAAINHIEQRLPGAVTRAAALADPAAPGATVAGDQQRNIDSLRLQNRTTLALGDTTVEAGLFLNAKQLFHPIYQVIDQKSVDYGAFLRADAPLVGDGPLPLRLAGGVTARFGNVAARQYVNRAGRRGALTADATQTANTIDAYAELRLGPVAGAQLVLGGVFTHGERRVTNRLAIARSGTADFDAFSPKIGVLWQPNGGDFTLYGNYSRSIELPGLAELSQTPFAGAGGAVAPGFVPVDLQRAWTAELGARWRIGSSSFEISVFRADLQGEMLQFDQAPGIPAATFNADRTRHQGIEAGLDLPLTRWALLRQVYQYSDFTFRGDKQFGNNRLPVIPEHVYRAELQLSAGPIRLTPNVEWLPRGAWADYANTSRAPAYALLGIGATADLRAGLTLFVDLRNLLDHAAIGDIGAAIRATPTSAIYYPVERRAAYAGVRARF